MYNKCCIEHCGTKRKDVKMHPFPRSEIRFKKWLLSINSDYLRSLSAQELQKLCELQKHFEKRFISEKYRLKVGSYPSLFSTDEITSGIPTKVDKDVSQKNDHNCPRKRKHDDHTYARLPDTSLAVPWLSEKPTINDGVSSISDTENNGNVTDQSLIMPSTSKMIKVSTYTDDVISCVSGTANEENELDNIDYYYSIMGICMTCNISTEKQYKYNALSLSPEIVSIIEEWTVQEVTDGDCICQECINLLLKELNNRNKNKIGERQLGHQSACVCCGISLARTGRASRALPDSRPERAFIASIINPRPMPANARACNSCWHSVRSNIDKVMEPPREAQVTNDNVESMSSSVAEPVSALGSEINIDSVV